MKREVENLYDFKVFGQAIKAARIAEGLSRNALGEEMNIAPRYLVSIENDGQHPSLQVFYELVTRFNVSVDQFFFNNVIAKKDTQRRQLESLLDGMSSKDLIILTATAKGIHEAKLEEGTK